jgi:endonuclease YncB( thermonuclease family)
LHLGEFEFAANAVVDGDTLRVAGVRDALRLIAIDTEEKFRSKADRQLYAAGWESYVRAKRGASLAPVKMATPMGDEATRFAREFFRDVRAVRLERDDASALRDAYGRHLVHALVRRDGRWVNYAVEAVRAGMSPYFVKYGYSRRYHRELAAAEAEARAARRGIWDPAREHYGDYDVRLAWWRARADLLAAFDAAASGRDHYISMDAADAAAQIARHEGRQVVVVGIVERIGGGRRGPTLVTLGRRPRAELPLVFFDRAVLDATGVAHREGELVRVAGRVTRYRARGGDVLQIVVERAGQVTVADVPWLRPTDARR